MQIMGLLNMYFDAVVAEVKNNLLLFRLALAILCRTINLNVCVLFWFLNNLFIFNIFFPR